jgi:hypothetical protein
MFRAMVWKELRDIRGILAIALMAQFYLVTAAVNARLSLLAGVGTLILPFSSGGFSGWFSFISGATAIALGLRQTLGESTGGTYLFLFHRPASRRWLIGVKLTVGAAAYFASSVVSIGAYSLWCATPGHLASPFLWIMTVPTWAAWFGLSILYFGAFLTGIRRGRWFLTRLLPLLAAGVFTGVTMTVFLVCHEWLSLILMLVVEAAIITAIQLVARTRDYA